MEGHLRNSSNIEVAGYRIINPYTITGFILILLSILIARRQIKHGIAQETAEMAADILKEKQLIQTLVTSIDLVATDPNTLASLAELVQKLLNDPKTQKAL